MLVILGMDGTKPKKGKHERKKGPLSSTDSIGSDLPSIGDYRVSQTEGEENRRRRALQLNKGDGGWGFTLQTYGIKRPGLSELEEVTYVDYVAFDGPAFHAGMRAGDVILSINGRDLETASHSDLVDFIKGVSGPMRMVVLFEDCVRKVELHLRSIKLKKILAEKVFELRSLETQEQRILSGEAQFGSCRTSIRSSNSSLASDWGDRLSLRPELDVCPASPVNPNRTSFYGNSTFYTMSPSWERADMLDAAVFTPGFDDDSLGDRFDFSRLSLPVGVGNMSGRLSPMLNSSVSGDVSFVRDKRVSSLRNDAIYRLPPPGGNGGGVNKRHSDPTHLKKIKDDMIEMQSLGASSQIRHSDLSLHSPKLPQLVESSLEVVVPAEKPRGRFFPSDDCDDSALNVSLDISPIGSGLLLDPSAICDEYGIQGAKSRSSSLSDLSIGYIDFSADSDSDYGDSTSLSSAGGITLKSGTEIEGVLEIYPSPEMNLETNSSPHGLDETDGLKKESTLQMDGIKQDSAIEKGGLKEESTLQKDGLKHESSLDESEGAVHIHLNREDHNTQL